MAATPAAGAFSFYSCAEQLLLHTCFIWRIFDDEANRLAATLDELTFEKDFPMKICNLLLLIAVPVASYAAGGYLIVANKGDSTIGIIEPNAAKQIATIPVGGITAHELTASPDGKLAFVPIYGNSGVGKSGTDGSVMAVIDLNTRKIVAKIDFGKGVRPHCPVFNPTTGILYVTTELENSLTIIDPKTLKIVGMIPTGQSESHMLAVSPDGRRGYTANVGAGTVSVLDLDSKKTLAVIPVSANVQRISITPDGSMVFTADQTKPRLAVISTATNTISSWIPLPAAGYGAAVTPDGQRLVIAIPDANKVSVIDLKARAVKTNLDVPAAPQAVLITPDGSTAYVSCDQSAKVAQIDLGKLKVTRLIQAGKSVDGLAWVK